MQDFLTFLVEFIAIGFALIMAFDFIIGLFNLFATIQRSLEPHSELQTQLELPTLSQVHEKEQLDQYLDPDLELQPMPEPMSELEPEPKPQPEPELKTQTEQQPYLDLSLLKIYKLRGESVVRVDHVNIEIPDTVKRYKLRKLDVIKLKELELLLS